MKQLDVERYGDVRPRLYRLRWLAQFEWDRAISYQEIMAATGLNKSSVRVLANAEKPRVYTLEALKVICWYFDCRIDDLLERVQPAGSPFPPAASRPTIARGEPPTPPPPGTLTLENTLPIWLARYSDRELSRGLDIDRATAYRLKTRPLSGIARSTFAALCTFLSEREQRDVRPGELLICGGRAADGLRGAGGVR